MARYIDADKIPYYLDTSENAPMEGRRTAFKSDIDKIPTADVVKVKHGYWVYNEDHNAYESEYFCSNCLADGSSDIRGENYCYNCGAKMDGERRGTNGRIYKRRIV